MKENKVDRLYETIRKIDAVYDLWASKQELTSYELRIYYEMLKKEDACITQKELCKKLEAPKTSINSIIKKQLLEGIIQMNVNPLNKREKILSFTEKGKKAAEAVINPLLTYEEEVSEMLDAEETETAIRVQVRLAELLEEKVRGDEA